MAQVPPPKRTFPWSLLGCLDCIGARRNAYSEWKKASNIPSLWDKLCLWPWNVLILGS